MKRYLLSLGLSLSVILSPISAVIAVQPVAVSDNDDIKWSELINHPFDGKIVYDRHYTNDFLFVSSWAKSGIRATYTQYRSEFAGYRTVWRSQPLYSRYSGHSRYGKSSYRSRYYYDYYPSEEPVYRTYATNMTPATIEFAINGQRYTYKEGTVPDDLAAALANAPNQNMLIRLVWDDGKTRDVEIGKGTVATWKKIFQPAS